MDRPAGKDRDPWILRYLDGDPSAVSEAGEWIRPVVRNRAWKLGEETKDLEQECHVRLLRVFLADRFRGESTIRSFVQSVAKHVCLDAVRSSRRHPSEEIFPEQFEAPGDGPLTGMIRDRSLELCYRVLEQIPEACRELFRALILEEQRYEDLAGRLGVPIGTVKSRIARCRDRAIRARKALEENLKGVGR